MGVPTYADTRAGALAGVRTMMVRHVAIGLISLGGTTYLIRELGPERWGGFAVAYLLLVSADAILSRALVAGLLRAAVPADREALASAARLLALGGVGLAAVLAVLPLVIGGWYDPPGFDVLLWAASGCALLFAMRALPATLLERDLRYGPVAAAEVGDMVAFYAVAIPLAAAGHGIAGLALGTIARGLVQLVVVRAARAAPVLGRRAAPAGRALLPFGLPLAAVLGLSALDGLVPIAVIGAYEREVGYLVVAAQVLGYGISLVTAVARVGIPSFARLTGDETARVVRRATEVSTFLTLSALVPVGALATLWLPHVFGDAFDDGTSTFQLVALGTLTAGPIGVWVSALTAAGRSASVLNAQVATLAAFLGFAVPLVLVMGPLGCAAAYAISRGVHMLWLGGVVRVRLRVGLGATIPVLLGAGLLAFAAIALGTDASAPVGIGLTAACAAVWLVAFRDLAGASLGALASRLGRPITP